MTVEGSPAGVSQSPAWATLEQIKEAAHARLSPAQVAYLETGSGAGQTLRLNRAAFERLSLLPSPLNSRGRPQTGTSLLGIELAAPILLAPVGPFGVFDPDGDIAVARAAHDTGLAAFIPVLSAQTLEETRRAAPEGARIFQALASGSESAYLKLAERAEAAGYDAICITIDAFPRSYRDRVDGSGFALVAEQFCANYGPEAEEEVRGHIDLAEQGWTWSTLTRVIAATSLPVIIKGVLSAGAARAAVQAGACAVVVSNTGGRQLDSAPSSLGQLPSIVAEVGAEVDVLLDSGVRRGADIVKALALGAKAVLVGRVVARGLAAGGHQGVVTSLRLLRAELETCMALCGCGELSQIGAGLVTEAT